MVFKDASITPQTPDLSWSDLSLMDQTPTGGVARFNKIKVPEPKPFCDVWDAKALENFIFDLEQYFRARATNAVAEEVKVTCKFCIRFPYRVFSFKRLP